MKRVFFMEIENNLNRKRYIERIHRALDFIDTHLGDEIRVEDLAQAASFSQFHFHRIFRAITGETPDDYVRRIRLEYAANLLFKNRSVNITEAAMRSGFSTPALFSRNFKKHFGIPPSIWIKSRNRQVESRNRNALPPPGALDIPDSEYRGEIFVKVKKLDSFRVVFIRHLYGYNGGIRGVFMKLFRWLSASGLITTDTRILGIPMDNPHITSPDRCRFYAAASIEGPVEPTGEVGVMDISGGLFAVARFTGQYKLVSSFNNRLYGEWLPDSGYEPADAFTFMVYIRKPDDTREGIHEFDQYIPVRPIRSSF